MKERINKRKKGGDQESNADIHIEMFLKTKDIQNTKIISDNNVKMMQETDKSIDIELKSNEMLDISML